MEFFRTAAFAAALAFSAGSVLAVPVPPPGAVAIDHAVLCGGCKYGNYQDFTLLVEQGDAAGFGKFLFWAQTSEFGFGEDPEDAGYFLHERQFTLTKAGLFFAPAGSYVGDEELEQGGFLFHFALSGDDPGNEIVASALYGLAAVPLPAGAAFLPFGLAALAVAGKRRRSRT